MMFDNLYDRHIGENMNANLVLYGAGFTLLQLAISWVFVCKIEKDNYERGAMIQALYRGNFVLLMVSKSSRRITYSWLNA